jgi:ubiquinone/menaquinone biosynthesis C-methylase UbiE
MNLVITKELNGRILDVGGGGDGVIGRVYGPQVTAIDISAEELAEAPEGFEKLVMDAGDMDFPDHSFDHVTAFYSFLFIPKPDHPQVISEISRVLRPGGTLHIWDCEVRTAFPEPFTVELNVDANGKQIHTTYGIIEQDCVQTAARFIELCAENGLRPIADKRTDTGFYLCFRRNASDQ